MDLYIIIPCYNEYRTIRKVINNIQKIKINFKIILIDDGSNDGTKEIKTFGNFEIQRNMFRKEKTIQKNLLTHDKFE